MEVLSLREFTNNTLEAQGSNPDPRSEERKTESGQTTKQKIQMQSVLLRFTNVIE